MPRVAPPRAGRQSDTSNFKISNFELKWGIGGKSIAASKTASGFYAQPSSINSEGQSAFSPLLTRIHISAESCRRLPRTTKRRIQKTSADNFREGNNISIFVNMSDISDSENISLSESVDAAGSTASTSSMSSSSARGATGPRDRTPDHLSGISDIPSGSRTAQARPTPVVDLTVEGGGASERTASQASTSGRSGDVASDSTNPFGEEIQARQRPRSRGARVNDMKVYRRADAEMVELAGDRPVYTADYYTSAVTLRYLAALRREFRIPDDVDLVVPRPNDLPSRPPSGHITLSAKYFRAGLRLPFHPFLRRALTNLNVAPAQLNANAYRVLDEDGSLVQGVLLLPGLQGMFIIGCPDSDKQFKHLWFYAGGQWLHRHLSYFELPPSKRVPVAFRRGYVWTRAPHAPVQTLAKIEELRELCDPERSQHRLLAEGSLKEYWVGSSSMSGHPEDRPT
ncbi:hypothetical protein TIFTF001_039067 [Ficus carica]|uniref:Uncharacterized protein n=1 Tax=Ficus carica TaxID=3494 RepID=A0AA88JAM2_FICCA|nr:hypothetical protein TIFTF001_039067 [Ficus carica]